jgi:hypothetical protein
MAKESGVANATLAIDDSGGTARTVSADGLSWSLVHNRPTIIYTGMSQSANERVQGVSDATLSIRAAFNDATNAIFDVLKTISSASVARTVTLTVSGQTLAMEMFIETFGIDLQNGGGLEMSATFVLSDGSVPTWA